MIFQYTRQRVRQKGLQATAGGCSEGLAKFLQVGNPVLGAVYAPDLERSLTAKDFIQSFKDYWYI